MDTPVSLGMDGYASGYAPGSFLWIVNNIYFQYYSLLIFLVSSAVLVIVSYTTEAPDPAQLRDLTFATMTEEHRRESRASWTQHRRRELGHRGGADPGGVPVLQRLDR